MLYQLASPIKNHGVILDPFLSMHSTHKQPWKFMLNKSFLTSFLHHSWPKPPSSLTWIITIGLTCLPSSSYNLLYTQWSDDYFKTRLDHVTSLLKTLQCLPTLLIGKSEILSMAYKTIYISDPQKG